MNAWDDLQEYLKENETVEAVVFGAWGFDGYKEPNPPPVAKSKRGVVLSPTEAMPMMDGWSFNGGYGAPECYAVRIWTSTRIIWVTQYDGATSLDSSLRNPQNCDPDMPGG